jgi:hypothetical protein
MSNYVGEPWGRWVQLLGAFAVLYVTLGVMAFPWAIED